MREQRRGGDRFGLRSVLDLEAREDTTPAALLSRAFWRDSGSERRGSTGAKVLAFPVQPLTIAFSNPKHSK